MSRLPFGSPLTTARNGRIHVTYDAESRVLAAIVERLTWRRHAAPPSPHTQTAAMRAAAYLANLSDAYGMLTPEALASITPRSAALVLDPSALAALGHGDVRARVVVARAVGACARILIPATALLDLRVAPIADAVGTLVAIDADVAREAGKLAARARLVMPLDALTVAVAAQQESATLLTSDRIGIAALARAADHPALYVLTL